MLARVLEEAGSRFEVVALSGTSGGAVCALFAWRGLARKDPRKAHRSLEGPWEDSSARSLPEARFHE